MAVWQGIGRAGALNGALVMSLAITMLGPRGAAIAADEDVLRTAIEERGWFGLPDGPDHVQIGRAHV